MITTLPLFPLNTVLFPGMPVYLHVFEERYLLMVRRCQDEDSPFGVVLIRRGQEAHGPPAEPYSVGCTARILKIEALEDGRMNLTAVGEERFRILSLDDDQPYRRGRISMLKIENLRAAMMGRRQALARLLVRYLRLLSRIGDIPIDIKDLQLPHDPLMLAYLAASLLQLPQQEKQPLLETSNAGDLLQQTERLLRREAALMESIGHTESDEARRKAWSN